MEPADDDRLSPVFLVDKRTGGFRLIIDMRVINAAFDPTPLTYEDLRTLRTSSGVEVRVNVPMLNVPFRLIYAWNVYRDAFQPGRALKFAVGTTF